MKPLSRCVSQGLRAPNRCQLVGACNSLRCAPGCEPGSPSTGTPINFVLGSTSTDVTGQSPLDPEPTLGHVIDNHLVSIPVNPADQTQLLNQQGAPIEGCQSSSTVLVPLPAVLWQNLVSGSSKLSTNPYQPRPQLGQPDSTAAASRHFRITAVRSAAQASRSQQASNCSEHSSGIRTTRGRCSPGDELHLQRDLRA